MPKSHAEATGNCTEYGWEWNGYCNGAWPRKVYYKYIVDCTGGYIKSQTSTGTFCCNTISSQCTGDPCPSC
ncbi:hypothetical protein [Actinocorallia aurea]